MNDYLVVYATRTGTTRLVAQTIADVLHADLEEIIPRRSLRGVKGYVRSSVEALARRPTAIEPDRHDPGAYRVVIVGTPVWRGSIAAPVRAYLERHRHKLRQVAFFGIERKPGGRRAFRQMLDTLARPPVATMVLTAAAARRRARLTEVDTFIAEIREATATPPAGAPAVHA